MQRNLKSAQKAFHQININEIPRNLTQNDKQNKSVSGWNSLKIQETIVRNSIFVWKSN